MNGQNVNNNESQNGSASYYPLQPQYMQYYSNQQMNQPNQYVLPIVNQQMGMNYAVPQQYFQHPHQHQQQYQQNWYGVNQVQPSYVDVTKSSKINYDDEDDEEEEDEVEEEDTYEQQKSNVEINTRGETEPVVAGKISVNLPEHYYVSDVEQSDPPACELTRSRNTEEEKDEDEDEEDEKASVAEVINEKVFKDAHEADVCIPGTSIVLKTEEDIEKWKEERKKMWLIKISNNKDMYRKKFNIKEDELHHNPLQESKKERNFIQSIQNQVKRFNNRPNLTVGLRQRILKEENAKILDFIKELGDANHLKYELTEEEKIVLFGSKDRKTDNGRRLNGRYDRQSNQRNNYSTQNYPRKRPIEEV
ncbi:unnamed protein product [Kluyveromyces dobzhanskii CBS 2104]|uniref:WGS project CCBQ000000000 data, contig 00011 n=1 Tax=Kluyveromyces dobzhanskii CBS 2104 TaxID=1427455 RepID=A0A0A8LA25_9SACH|nr:unnamed protein product [Kluyveromyces dobzhanskii CBS 2104]